LFPLGSLGKVLCFAGHAGSRGGNEVLCGHDQNQGMSKRLRMWYGSRPIEFESPPSYTGKSLLISNRHQVISGKVS
jgi:hypothetical protein